MTDRIDAPPQVRAVIDKAYRDLYSNPEYLLREPIGVSMGADAVVARLYGHDDQLDREWRIPSPPSQVLRVPLPAQAAYMAEGALGEPPPEALYELMNGWAMAAVSADGAEVSRWFGTDPSAATFQHSLLCVRYERRMPSAIDQPLEASDE